MRRADPSKNYFPYDIQLTALAWRGLGLEEAIPTKVSPVIFQRRVALRFNERRKPSRPLSGATLHLYGLLLRIFRYLVDNYADLRHPQILEDSLGKIRFPYDSAAMAHLLESFVGEFPPAKAFAGEAPAVEFLRDDAGDRRKKEVLKELILLWLARENPAVHHFSALYDDRPLAGSTAYEELLTALDATLAQAPQYEPYPFPLLELLRQPVKASPHSLRGQLDFVRENWRDLLPADILTDILTAFDIIAEEEREWWSGTGGRQQVLEFRHGWHGEEYPEPEQFSIDADWMANVVLMAKMVYVWLDQLSKEYQRPITTLDRIPDEELDRLARWGFTGLWLIGLWERSPASQNIKRIAGNPEALSSAYSLYDYVVAADLGGAPALQNLKERAAHRGIRLASDMVPNHTGIYSRWTVEHPDWFIQQDYPPYPAYSFTGPDLSLSPEISLRVEDGYWSRTDAAVVFQHVDHRDGRVRYIYHGNDGTSTPWNDTAQLNYLLAEVREAVIRTILHVAAQFPIIRFDAAMTLAKKHYQRLWFPQPGHGGGVPSRAEQAMERQRFDEVFPTEFWREVVDRVAAEAPDTLLLAEAFWLMEGYFVRTLGMHRVYNSAFMNMLKMEENAKYRQTVKNVLEFDPRVLQRFVNFMNNPDEKTAVEQFGKEGKYYGACVLLVTMPGLPMFGHGQIEGFREKYGMEYRKAYWEEPVDGHMVWMHEAKIFPLMRRRHLFSGAGHFVFYDFFAGSHVDENVFAYSNRFGNERAIIVYHNRFADTNGWIRTSTAIARRNDQGDGVLATTTLGEALEFRGDGGRYYSFRDYATGLEYIRSGQDLCEKGLFFSLGGYQYYALLDFREICDDEYGNWGKLCRNLGGGGVASLEEEVRQVRYAAVVAAFRQLLNSVAALGEVAAGSRRGKKGGELLAVEESALAFYRAAAEHMGGLPIVDDLLAGYLRALQTVRRISVVKPRATVGEEALARFTQLLGGQNLLLLHSFLILRDIGRLYSPFSVAEHSAALINELGLSRIIADEGGAKAVPLVRALIVCQPMMREWEEKDGREQLQALLSDPRLREFLLIHQSDGINWFNKERWEELLWWLSMAELIELGAPLTDGGLTKEATRLHDLAEELAAVAVKAGYRVDALPDACATLWGGGAKPAKSSVRKPRKKGK